MRAERIIGRAAIAMVLAACVTSVAQADLIAYDGFWDAEGGHVYGQTINDKNTGYGWVGSWSVTAEQYLNVNNVFPVADGYAYTGLATAGGRCKWNNPGRRHYAKRTFASPAVGADGTTLWISFLHYKGDGGRDNAFYLYNGAAVPVRLLAPSTDLWQLQVADQTVTTSVNCDKKLNLVLLRIDFKAGNDDVYFWAGTASGTSSEPSTASAAASFVGTADFMVDALQARGGQYTTDYWDEFRVGETFFDVTQAAPTRIRSLAATDVGATSARLNAQLEAGGPAGAMVYAYWGETDGGTDPLAWAFGGLVAAATDNGMYSTNVTVAANTAYVFRFLATNEYGVSWTPTVQPFSTKAITISASDPVGDETIDNTLTFRVTRDPGTVGAPLTVNIGLEGTAINGTDYETLSNPLTAVIAAGETYVDIMVTPKQDIADETDETVVATLQAGAYVIGTPCAATGTIQNAAVPGSPTNVWIGSGSAATGANWSLGHAPTSGEVVLLDGYSRANMTWDSTASATVAEWLQLSHYTGTVTVDTRYEGAFTALDVPGDVTVSGGSMTHVAHGSSSTRQYCLRLNVGGDLIVSPGAMIHANAKGFPASYGPGRAGSQDGAAYGGTGGNYSEGPTGLNTYGSVLNPIDPGSGGSRNASAGGAVIVTVAGGTTVDGAIRADGGNPSMSSGGSILLRTGTLQGGGTVSANGGSGDADSAGGGGRVAVYLATGSGTGGVALSADAGKSSRDNDYRHGASGTVYLQTAGQTEGGGTVSVNTPSDISISWDAVANLPAAWSGTYGNYDYVYSENLSRSTWAIGRSTLQLKADVRLAAMSLASNSTLELNGFTLELTGMTITGARIPNGTYSSADLDRVNGAGTVIIRSLSGSVILVR